MNQFLCSLIFLSISCLSPFYSIGLTVSDLGLEEKIGQLLVVHFHGQQANEEAKEFIQDLHVGGFIYYNWGNGLSNPKQVQDLSQGLQMLAQKTLHSIPLFIAIDQEGGRVVRLKEGFTVFPGNYALGQTGQWEWGEKSARMMGLELKAVGVSLNLAPVLDVAIEPANPVIGIRAFSSDPSEVAKWGSCALQGYKKAGVIPVLKHFPGHGDVQMDSHEGLPIVRKKREALDLVELYPFRSLADQADAMMTAHLMVPALDSEQIVTFSKRIVTDLLRKEYHFEGVIMTDSLAMQGALSQSSSLEDAVLKSIEAGHDLVLLGGKQLLASQRGLEFNIHDVRRVHRFLIEAVKEGRLSEQRIDESVSRILALKEKYGLFKWTPLNSDLLNEQVKTASHVFLAQCVAQRALRVVKGVDLLPAKLSDSPYTIVVPEILREELAQTSWQLIRPQDQILYFKDLNPDDLAIQEIVSSINKNSKRCFYFGYNGWQFPKQRELFQQIKSAPLTTFAILVRDPIDVDYFNHADVILCTYSPVAFSLQAAFDCLVGEIGGEARK